ncbi:N-acetylmuramoyl-L-alanine amidase [Paenibacillus wynnii]|uniref:N-acetylmuramoyl-L-alanine amidase n=1 Tax=Paenibacillus wynnii TaxID=268407 RepID=UPI0027D79CA9|nr:N-acetylmuramoyl-L-alanine amidase [Paenibacillus wynnii]
MGIKVKRILITLITSSLFLATGFDYTYAAPEQNTKHSPFILGNDQRVILIDAGHGGVDGGTSYGTTLEKDLTLAISRKLYLILRSNGLDAVLNRFDDYALSDENRWFPSSSRHRRDLTQRKGLADAIPTSVVVSIHVNWAPSSAKSGPLVLYRKEGRSFMLAKAIQNQLNRLYDVNVRPEHGKPFYLLNKITATTVIVEAGYISSPIDRSKLYSKQGQKEIAEAIANGIAVYLTEV